MTVARPQHVCMPLSGRREHRPARSTCADAPVLRSSPLGANMVGKSRNMSADMLFMPVLLALMPLTICCVRSQSVRDLVTEISGGATPHRCGVAQSSSSELATQARPSSRLMMAVHVGSRSASSGSPTQSSLGRRSAVPSSPPLPPGCCRLELLQAQTTFTSRVCRDGLTASTSCTSVGQRCGGWHAPAFNSARPHPHARPQL